MKPIHTGLLIGSVSAIAWSKATQIWHLFWPYADIAAALGLCVAAAWAVINDISK